MGSWVTMNQQGNKTSAKRNKVPACSSRGWSEIWQARAHQTHSGLALHLSKVRATISQCPLEPSRYKHQWGGEAHKSILGSFSSQCHLSCKKKQSFVQMVNSCLSAFRRCDETKSSTSVFWLLLHNPSVPLLVLTCSFLHSMHLC